MKKIMIGLIALVVIVAVMVVKQQSVFDISSLQEVTYTNLAEEETQELAKKELVSAGVSENRQQKFFDAVQFFVESVDREFLTNGFEKGKATGTKYDPYVMQEQWDKKNKEFNGYDCRITSCSLMGDFIVANPVKDMNTDDIIFDLQALEQDGRIFEPKDYNTFLALFSGVLGVEKTKDVMVHVEELQKAWSERGVRFLSKTDKISLISVVFHNQITEEDSRLFIGHVGVLIQKTDGGMYFIEKVAFQEPYRMNLFENRTQLSDYLMQKYDIEVGQPTSVPFIMENDKLMEGYRPNPQKKETK